MKAAKAERMKSHLEKTLVQIAKAVEQGGDRAEGVSTCAAKSRWRVQWHC